MLLETLLTSNLFYSLIGDFLDFLLFSLISLTLPKTCERFWFCSCVPLRSFEYIYNYLMHSNLSYVDW